MADAASSPQPDASARTDSMWCAIRIAEAAAKATALRNATLSVRVRALAFADTRIGALISCHGNWKSRPGSTVLLLARPCDTVKSWDTVKMSFRTWVNSHLRPPPSVLDGMFR